MKAKYLLGVVGFVVVLALGMLYPRTPNLTSTKDLAEFVRNEVNKFFGNASDEGLGAFAGPVVNRADFTINGVTTFVMKETALTGTTTPCQLKSPNATTTIISLTDNLNSFSTTTAGRVHILTIATSTVQNATTSATPIFQHRVQGAAQHIFSLYASTSPSDVGTSKFLLAPNTYVNWGISGNDNIAGISPTGQCVITAQKL